MDLTLTRNRFGANGIFGELNNASKNLNLVTLEHSFDLKPKLSPGTYTCVRGKHQLLDGKPPFVTFEITGVPDFQGNKVTKILFHTGNWNVDSEGCVILGCLLGQGCVLESKIAFDRFMDLQTGCDSFTLVVDGG